MFYEMLTGEVPSAARWAEVALRHQTDLPELSRVPKEYLAIIEKAQQEAGESFRGHGRNDQGRGVSEPGWRTPQAGGADAGCTRDEARTKVPALPPPLPKRNPPPVPRNGSQALLLLPRTAWRAGHIAGNRSRWRRRRPVAWAGKAVPTGSVDWFGLMPMFGLTVMMSWAVLVPGKIRERRRPALRTWMMMLIGAGIG